MLQIVIWIMCAYLVIKGFEFLMTALASSREDKSAVIAFAAIMIVVCSCIALIFARMASTQVRTPGLSMLTSPGDAQSEVPSPQGPGTAEAEQLRDRCAGNSSRGSPGFLACVKALGVARTYYEGSKLVEY
jgi:hypothetical protein